MDDTGGNGGDTCFVHLFDSDNFDETDDNFILDTPGRYANIRTWMRNPSHWS